MRHEHRSEVLTMHYQSVAEFRQAWIASGSDPAYKTALSENFYAAFVSMSKKLRAWRYSAHDHWRAQIETTSQHKIRALTGVPLAHKELFHRKGWPAEGGSCSLRGAVAQETAFAIDSLDRAGAWDLGRVSSVEFALGTTGHHAMMGTPINPWHADYLPGGSSSGSAVMVAAGTIPASLGTDTGGSVRLPAAACGLFGLKPTLGTVSRTGVFPLSQSLDTVGAMARTPADLEAVFAAICGDDPHDPASVDYHYVPFENSVKNLRLGIAQEHFFTGTDTEVTDVIMSFLQSLSCASIEDVHLAGIEQTNDLVMLITAFEAAEIHGETLPDILNRINAETALRIATGLFIDRQEYLRACSVRRQLLQQVLKDVFSKVDIVITPLWPYQIPRVSEVDAQQNPNAHHVVHRTGWNTRPWNFLGLPAMSVPIDRDKNGLPISIQIVAGPFGENVLFAMAKHLEEIAGFWHQRPKISL